MIQRIIKKTAYISKYLDPNDSEENVFQWCELAILWIVKEVDRGIEFFLLAGERILYATLAFDGA